MAKGAPSCLFLAFLALLTVCSLGNVATSTNAEIASFLAMNKVSSARTRMFVGDHMILNSLSNTGMSFDLILNETLVEDFLESRTFAISWLKSNLVTLSPHVKINSVALSTKNGLTELPKLLSTLELVHSVISQFRSSVHVSVAFPLSFLGDLSRSQERDLRRILEFIKDVKSFVVIEDDIDRELNMGDRFAQVVVERASLAASILPSSDVPVILKIRNSDFSSAKEATEIVHQVSQSLENTTENESRIAGIFAEGYSSGNFAEKELKREGEEEQDFHASRRELLNSIHLKTTLHDMDNPPTVYPTTPSSTTPLTTPPGTATPTIVTVPSTNPVTVTPNGPSTPVQIPSTTPVNVPPSIPTSSPPPTTNPATTPSPIPVPGAQPGSTPVAAYPPPSPTNPVTTPVTNPVPPPATTNAPAVPGQSWCIAKTGISQTALQAALDYACGMGGADCSQIQQGGSCYNPVTLENHASFAFNSYYQKHPGPTSCDFGGAATITNTNPSTGSCIYPSSSSSSSTPTSPQNSTPKTPPPPTTISPPTSTTPPPPTTISPPTSTTPPPTTISPPKSPTPPSTMSPPTPSGTGVSGSGILPTVLNSSSPDSTTGFGIGNPPSVTTTDSMSASLQPFIGCTILITSLVTGKIILAM